MNIFDDFATFALYGIVAIFCFLVIAGILTLRVEIKVNQFEKLKKKFENSESMVTKYYHTLEDSMEKLDYHGKLIRHRTYYKLNFEDSDDYNKYRKLKKHYKKMIRLFPNALRADHREERLKKLLDK